MFLSYGGRYLYVSLCVLTVAHSAGMPVAKIGLWPIASNISDHIWSGSSLNMHVNHLSKLHPHIWMNRSEQSIWFHIPSQAMDKIYINLCPFFRCQNSSCRLEKNVSPLSLDFCTLTARPVRLCHPQWHLRSTNHGSHVISASEILLGPILKTSKRFQHSFAVHGAPCWAWHSRGEVRGSQGQSTAEVARFLGTPLLLPRFAYKQSFLQASLFVSWWFLFINVLDWRPNISCCFAPQRDFQNIFFTLLRLKAGLIGTEQWCFCRHLSSSTPGQRPTSDWYTDSYALLGPNGSGHFWSPEVMRHRGPDSREPYTWHLAKLILEASKPRVLATFALQVTDVTVIIYGPLHFINWLFKMFKTINHVFVQHWV